MASRRPRTWVSQSARFSGRSSLLALLLVTTTVSAITVQEVESPSASAQCVSFPSGTYAGTWEGAGFGREVSGSYGATFTFSGSTVSGSVTFISGSFDAGSTPFSGAVTCDDFVGTFQNGGVSTSVSGGSGGNGTLDGGWTNNNGQTGSFSMGLVDRQVVSGSPTESFSSGASTSPSEPIQVTVVSPNGDSGIMAFSFSSVSGQALPEYGVLGQNVVIGAPVASEAQPLTITFLLDPSITIGQAQPPMFRNGALIPPCASPTLPLTSATDPCVESYSTDLVTGDVTVTVLASQASFWNTGSPCSLSIVSSSLLPAAVAGSPYVGIVGGCGGTPPYKFARKGRLPKGLKLNPKSGVITGSPKVAGISRFSVTMKDSSHLRKHKVTKAFSLTVEG